MAAITRYAHSSGCAIAYQVLGDGPVDVLFVQGLISHLDMQWSDPEFARFLRQVAAVARLIVMDQRGVGLSDAAPNIPTVDTRASDILAVADAAGSGRAVVIGHCHGGPGAIAFAAANPERVEGLVLMSTFAKGNPDSGHPGAVSENALHQWNQAVANWGQGRSLELFVPSKTAGAVYRRLYATFERAALSPGMARAAVESTRVIDVSKALGSIRAPALVVHCSDDFLPVTCGAYIAGAIEGSEFLELSGSDHAPFAGKAAKEVTAAVVDFIRGCHSSVTVPTTRFRAVMMTDLVDSTVVASKLGDAEWADTLTAHDYEVREAIDRSGGDCVKFTGDGYLAIFPSCEMALHCATALVQIARQFSMAIRCGIHAGDYEPFGDDAVGITVVSAARLMTLGGASEIVASDTVMSAVGGAGFHFGPTKPHRLKGISEPLCAASLLTDGRPVTEPRVDTDMSSPHLRRFDRLVMAGVKRFSPLARVVARRTAQIS